MQHVTAGRWAALTPADYGRALRRHHWLILVLVLLGAAGAGLAALVQTPLYRASAQVLFSPNFARSDITQLNDGSNYILQRTPSYAEIADSPQVASAVIGKLHLPYPPAHLMAAVQVTTKAGTAVMDIAVVDPDPTRARDLANAFAGELAGFVEQLETPTGGAGSPVKVSIASPAAIPASPDSPHTGTDIGLGLVAGFVIGAALAVIRHVRALGSAAVPTD
jgi:tyrosine-protein kinase